LPWTYLGVEFRTDVSDTTFVVPNTSGCDSLITYNLYVHWNSTTILDSSICENNLPLIWNGIEFNSSSDSSVVLIGRYGVDSIVNMHVTVLQNSTAIISDTVLENQLPHRYLDIIFTTDIDTTLIISNAVGCDSIISYSLHVNRNIYIELDSAICENNLPFVWYGVEFNSAGDTIVTVPVRNIDGIDSVITLHVDILPTFSSVDDVYLCYGDSLIWIDGNTYYSNTNEPIFILEASNGCDSIINLHLRVDEGKIVSRMKVSPTMVTHEQRMIDLVDLSEYSSDRIWVLPDMVSTNKICRYEYPIDKDSVEITLIAYNEHECSDTSRTIVRMDGDIFVPNAFTPNMESNNKFFVVTKNINSINVRIYDRNGGFIYQYNTLDGEWDGRRNGQVCPQGSYVYRIEYTTKANPNELKTRIGTVTLLR
jgi:gliding motility-associated-like protein